MKISEAFMEYEKNEVLAMNYSVNTYRAYKNTATAVIKHFGDVSIRKINIDSVHEFYLRLIDKISRNTARRYVSNLRTVIRYCRKRGLRVMNPDEIRTPREEKKVARFITHEEYRRFIATAGEPQRGYSRVNLARNVLIIKMLYETGLRVGELCALNRDSIHDRQFVVIGKSKEPRPCYITKEVELMIRDYLDMRNDDNNALFVASQNGERITTHNVQSVFRNVSRKAGIGIVTPHTLRHSYATRFLEYGVDIRIVAALLGHQNLSTTQKYTHVTDYILRQTYEKTMAKKSKKVVEKYRFLAYNEITV